MKSLCLDYFYMIIKMLQISWLLTENLLGENRFLYRHE